jgi:hypothetical protein
MPASLIHAQQPFEGLVRSQSLSTARLIFLICLVVFFTVLFVVTYVWMRKPGFGQHGGHEQPAVSRKVAAPKGPSTLSLEAVSEDAVAPNPKNIDSRPETALVG